MRIDVPMPVITEPGEEGVVTAWFVDDGQAVTEGLLIAEVQAEKVSEQIHAPADGHVVDRVAIGVPVAQGEPICRVVDTVGESRAPASEVPPPVRASPAAKRLARQLGVDLDTVTGSGPEGRITEADVAAAGPAPSAVGTGGLRAVIARNMRRSVADTAPVTLFSTVRLGGVPEHLTAAVVKAAAETLADHPDLNGVRQGDRFVTAKVAHIALAIQTDEGLVAPVVQAPAGLSVEEIAARIGELAGRARARSLAFDDFRGATFSVSNLGSYGIEGFTPIINLPQVAILGVGVLRKVPVFDDEGDVRAGHVMTLSLTFDHAFVDGAPAAAFLRDLVNRLGVPS